mgnify:CR=1 FL=1|tara:strand:- start:354 stop:1820 length:1467 start_codon:yes stop_codon:yes gene_type:complete
MPYIGRSLGDGVRARYIYAATSGQTTFSGNDANGIALAYSDTLYMDVYQNGVLLKPVTDYASTTGTSVVLVTGASTDDVVEMIVYDSFAVADTVSAANGGSFGGAVSMASTLDVTGAITSSAGATITTADNTSQLTVKSTDSDASSGPIIDLIRDSGSPADNDVGGMLRFKFDNDAAEEIVGVKLKTQLNDASDGTEDASLSINTMVGGTERSRILSNSTETVFNNDQQDLDFRVESSTNEYALYLNAGLNRFGIGTAPSRIFNVFGDFGGAGYIAEFTHDGNNSNRYGIIIQVGADDASGTNYVLIFRDGDGNSQGSITFSGGTVTYGAFTAHHPCIIPNSDNDESSAENAYPYGTLLETTSVSYSKKSGADTERGIRYNVQKTQSANSKAVLGAYGSSMNNGPDEETNLHQALVLGDGHILCNNSGGNIEVGDGICSSATAGIGQKATVNPSMIIGIAQEAVTFSSGSETKLVAVQYGLQQFIPWS